jgi:hypothetical protein
MKLLEPIAINGVAYRSKKSNKSPKMNARFKNQYPKKAAYKY